MKQLRNRYTSAWVHQLAALLLSLFLFVPELRAQDNGNGKDINRYTRVDASYLIGGQVYNDAFIYNAGFGMQTAYGRVVNKNLLLGLGTGFYQFDHERFAPLYFEALGYRNNKKNTPFVKMQAGYSFGWLQQLGQTDEYEFGGGLFFDAGLGRKIKIGNGYSMMFQCSYRHQFAKLEYTIFATETYHDILNYDMIVLSLSIIHEK